MTGLTFEGEVDSLTTLQKELISDVLKKREIKANKVRIETLGQAGDNYIANVKRITAELDNGETFKMVAKVAPTHEMIRNITGTVIVFANECAMYNEVLPTFLDLQKAADLEKDELYRFPECYGTLMEPFNEIILLEDLKDSNFEMLDRFKPLTNESVRLVLKNFAILHSLSFVLKKRDFDTFDSLVNKFGDFYSLMSTNPDSQLYLRSIETDIIAILDSDRYKKAVTGTLSQLTEHTVKLFKFERNSRYSVIIHGDSWTNNIMFRLKENVPVEAVMIDYQISKVGHPVHDIMHMIFYCTDYGSRNQYYYEWIDYYHSELDKSLGNFGLKANYVYPRDQLDADLRRYSKAYLATVLMFNSMFIRKSDDAARMKETMERAMKENGNVEEMSASINISNLDPVTVSLFKRNVEELVDSYHDFGYID